MEMQIVHITRQVAGALLLTIALFVIGLVFLLKVKIKFPDLKWVKTKMLITFGLGVFITLTIRQFWWQDWDQFFKQNGWYAWLAVIVANLLFCLLFGREGNVESGSGGSAHGSGEKSGLSGLAVLLVAIVAIGIIAANGIRNGWLNFGQPTRTAAASNQLEPEGSWFPRTATTNTWTAIHVGRGIKMSCVVDHPTAHILARYNNEPAHEDWRDQELVPPPRETPYDFYIKSAGADPVPVKIYLTQ